MAGMYYSLHLKAPYPICKSYQHLGVMSLGDRMWQHNFFLSKINIIVLANIFYIIGIYIGFAGGSVMHLKGSYLMVLIDCTLYASYIR